MPALTEDIGRAPWTGVIRAAIRVRLCGFPLCRSRGREGDGIGRRNLIVELIVARLVSELLTVGHCGHRCAGPFVARNLEA
jgi:hypothetical protein